MTLMEEVKTLINDDVNEEIRLLETIKKPILARTKNGHRDYMLTDSTLDVIFRDTLNLSRTGSTETRKFFELLQKLNKVLLAEGFAVKAKLNDHMEIVFLIEW